MKREWVFCQSGGCTRPEDHRGPCSNDVSNIQKENAELRAAVVALRDACEAALCEFAASAEVETIIMRDLRAALVKADAGKEGG